MYIYMVVALQPGSEKILDAKLIKIESRAIELMRWQRFEATVY